jgi:hypothetical protein
VTWLACRLGAPRLPPSGNATRPDRSRAGTSGRERALNADNVLQAAQAEIRAPAPASGQLPDQPRDAERELTGEAIQPTATENTTLKHSVRQLTAGNRSLAGRLEAARSGNRIPAGASPISDLSSPGQPSLLGVRVPSYPA